MFWTILAMTALAGVGGTGLGGLVGALFKKDSSKTVSLLLSFAGGVMLSVVCFDMISSSMSTLEASGLSMTPGKAVLLTACGILLGYLVVYLLNNLIDRKTNHEVQHVDKSHPKTADDLNELIHADHLEYHKKTQSAPKSQLFTAGIIMASAIALHNMPEGMVIGASYAADGANAFGSSISTGLVTAMIIGLHNIPEGMAVSVPLISGGMPKWKAVLLTALTGAPTILGAIIGFLVGQTSPVGLCLALSFASGAMIYVVFGELLPESILMWRSKAPAFATLVGMLVGLVMIYV